MALPNSGLRPLSVLQISTTNRGGGAASIASSLARQYRDAGVAVHQAVGRNDDGDPDAIVLGRHASRVMRIATDARALRSYVLGYEDFDFPRTFRMLDALPAPPDIIECHNLHGGYFDLRALPWLSRQAPTVLVLHDAWLLSGHCAHSFDCDKWQTGCGACPDLSIEPALRRDGTAHNWTVKQGIYAQSRVYVATPCRWLSDRVAQSMLAPAVVDSRVFPNGIDLTTFTPGDKGAARRALGIPSDAAVLLTSSGRGGELWRDVAMLRRTLRSVADRCRARDLRIIVIGGEAPTLDGAGVHILQAGHVEARTSIARYFHAADVYVHAARADTFPTMILEALACGTPVVATRAGGIPEQIDDGVNGRLAVQGDDAAFADATLALLADVEMRGRMSANAARTARDRFDAVDQANAYLSWYRTIIASRERDAVD